MGEKLTLNDVMAAYAGDAVNFARQKFQVTLDYSVESIGPVEEIAKQLYSPKAQGLLGKLFNAKPSPQDLEQTCKMLGGYIGEVYRRQKGGEWAMNDKFKVVGICRGTSWIFPPAKVQKRLINGDEDNLQFYFQFLMTSAGA